MERKYKSFVCYRGKLGGSRMQYAPSEDVATIIAYWINSNAKLDVHPALFEAKCKSGEVSYDPVGIDKFMRGMKKVFAIICPDFFREIIDLYNESVENMTKEAAVEFVKQELEKDRDKNIYYFELKKAFSEGGSENIVFPIIVENGTTSPTLSEREANIVINIFGEKMRNILRGVNLLTFDYRVISPRLLPMPTWNEGKGTNETIRELEKIPAVQEFKHRLIESLNKVDALEVSFTKSSIKSDLQKCTQTISNHQLPKSAQGGQSHNHFNAHNPEIIYDPVFIRHKNPPPPFLAKCMVDEFNANKNPLGLSSDYFGFWEVDFKPNQQFEGISVCAVCFGTLILQHRLKKDSGISSACLNEGAEKHFTDKMNAGINLLIALRNPYNKTWPSSWIFSDSALDRDGTVNQTTLGLSTLISCGFLSRKCVADNNVLRARYEFIWESVECLLEAELRYYDYNNALCKGWGYGIDPQVYNKLEHDPSELAMTAFTAFVFDTLQKIGKSTEKLMERFADDAEFLCILKERKMIVDDNLRCILHYFKDRQRAEDGAFERTSIDDNLPSLTHTSYVVKSLVAFLSDYYIGDEESDLASKILKKGVEYIMTRTKEMYDRKHFNVFAHERFEIDGTIRDAYNKQNMDQYEHCVEFIVAVTLMKIADFVSEYKADATRLVKWIMNMYLGTGADSIVRKGTSLFVRSSRESRLMYPIFNIYYYRMMLQDYLKSYDSFEEGDGNEQA